MRKRNIIAIICSVFLSFCKNDGGIKQVVQNYANGKIKLSYQTVNGKIEGVVNEYYENGTLKSTEHWHDSIRSGIAKYYYPNGEIQEEGNFTKGYSSGCWYKYYKGKKLKSFNEYWFLDSMPILSHSPNRYLDFDSLGNVVLSKRSIYYETKIVEEKGKRYLKIDAFYVPDSTNYRIIYQTKENQKLDTLEGNGYPHFMFPLSSTDFVKGDFQFYSDIYIKGQKFIRTYDSFFDSRFPTCNIESWDYK